MLDIPKVEQIAKKWGVGLDANMFASAILLRPSHIKKDKNKVLPPPKTGYELQLEAKAQLKALLESEQLIPRELIFITRCQRMMQANNQMLGSPSARINITAKWAAIGYTNSLTGSRTLDAVGLRIWLKDRWQGAVFRFTLWLIDMAHWFTQIKCKLHSS